MTLTIIDSQINELLQPLRLPLPRDGQTWPDGVRPAGGQTCIYDMYIYIYIYIHTYIYIYIYRERER